MHHSFIVYQIRNMSWNFGVQEEQLLKLGRSVLSVNMLVISVLPISIKVSYLLESAKC